MTDVPLAAWCGVRVKCLRPSLACRRQLFVEFYGETDE